MPINNFEKLDEKTRNFVDINTRSTELNQISGITKNIYSIAVNFKELKITCDEDAKIIWCSMNPKNGPNFTLGMLSEQLTFFRFLKDQFGVYNQNNLNAIPYRYVIQSSLMPNIFNYGGDLKLFAQLIRDQNRNELLHYAKLCIDCQFLVYNNFYSPLLTIAYAEGDALAGGFELVLANDIIVSKKNSKFGMTEILFNLFPGMGAFSFLSRKITISQAEFMIFSGRTYSTDELFQMGLIDAVLDDAPGNVGIYRYIKSLDKQFHTRCQINQIRKKYYPITYDELLDITTRWVDAALLASNSDLRKMEKLVSAQNRKWKIISL